MRTAAIYNFLIEANLIAGLAILLMIPIRKFFRKQLGNRAICFAWLLVAVRLLCPLSLPNPLINELLTPYNYDQQAVRPIAGQVRVRVTDALQDAAHRSLVSAMVVGEGAQAEDRQFSDYQQYQRYSGMVQAIDNGRAAKRLFAAYLGGAGAIVLWMAAANVRFRRRMKRNRFEPLTGEMLERYRALCARYGVKPVPVYWTDPLSSACLVGVVKPYIALPLAAGEEQALQMLAHEICHVKARDHVWTLMTLLCCVVHWFDPLVWAAAAMSRMDRELRCDDLVTREMDDEEKRRYAGALIQAVTRRAVPGMPMLATGMSMTGRKLKTRVSSILHSGRRMKALTVAFAGAASLLLVLAFGTTATAFSSFTAKDADEAETNAAAQEGAYDAAWVASIPTAQMGEYDADHLIRDEIQAVGYAKMLWTGPLMQWSIEGASCSAFRETPEEGWGYDAYTTLPNGQQIGVSMPNNPALSVYHVIFYLENGHTLGVTFHSDGQVEYLFNGDLDNYLASSSAPEGTREEREALMRQAIDIARTLEPGLPEENLVIKDYGDKVLGDVRFAYFGLETPGGDERTVCVTLPDMIVVEYGTGNG